MHAKTQQEALQGAVQLTRRSAEADGCRLAARIPVGQLATLVTEHRHGSAEYTTEELMAAAEHVMCAGAGMLRALREKHDFDQLNGDRL